MFTSMWVILVIALQLMAVGLASEYRRHEERDFEGDKEAEEAGDDTLDTAVVMQPPAMASGPTMTAEHREVLLRLRHIEKAYNLTQFNPDFDDMNHLEYYWHEISHFVKSSVPPTDEQCYFNVTAWRCFPVCQCSFQPRPGDYTPSRYTFSFVHLHGHLHPPTLTHYHHSCTTTTITTTATTATLPLLYRAAGPTGRAAYPTTWTSSTRVWRTTATRHGYCCSWTEYRTW